MIDKLRSMAIFATVVEQGSFRAAARHLELAPSRVSQSVSGLEKELGITLLYRSTRQLSLTSEGQALYSNVKAMLQSAEAGLDAINQISKNTVGELRVTAPEFVTQTGMLDVFTEFLNTHPGVSVKFNFSDHPQDLIKEGFDVGIRAGMAKDSELMTRTVGETGRLLVASPHYVALKDQPESPEHLADWNWIQFAVRPERMELYSYKGEKKIIDTTSRVEVDSANALYQFAKRGMGLTPLPEKLANSGISRGELIHILPDWKLLPLQLQAIWPDKSRRENLALTFVRFLADKSHKL